MDAAVWVIAVVVLVILCLIVACQIVYRMTGRRATAPAKVGGVEDSARHALGKAIHAHRVQQVTTTPPAPILTQPPQPQTQKVQGGAAAKKASQTKRQTGRQKKPWTEYKSWAALKRDPGAWEAYKQNAAEILNTLDIDWSGVMAELQPQLRDNREWAGRINVTNGKAEIVELVPSPYAVGEGPLGKGAAAMVPAEVIEKLAVKPAMFLFHTHPGDGAGMAMPSAIDIVGGAFMAYTGEFAADLVISQGGVFLYTPDPKFRADIDSQPTAKRGALATFRKGADLLAALLGNRSWVSPWSLETFAATLKQYGIEYVTFPSNKYARAYYRTNYTQDPDKVDFETLDDYRSRAVRLEKEIEQAKKKQTGRRKA